jgi:hypothetical protein
MCWRYPLLSHPCRTLAPVETQGGTLAGQIREMSNGIRVRGEQVFRAGLVTVIETRGGVAKARVQGSATRPYDVRVGLDYARGGEAQCTCPYFADWGVCKHVHATWLALTGATSKRSAAQATPRPEAWTRLLAEVSPHEPPPRPRPPRRLAEVRYCVDVATSKTKGRLVIAFVEQTRRKDGSPGARKPVKLDSASLDDLPLNDRRLLAPLLDGAEPVLHRHAWYGYGSYGDDRVASVSIGPGLYDLALPLLQATGRFEVGAPYGPAGDVRPVEWDAGAAWRLAVELSRHGEGDFSIAGFVRRDGEQRDLAAPTLILIDDGLLILDGRLARFDAAGAGRWVVGLRKYGAVRIGRADADRFLTRLFATPGLPSIDLPPELGWSQERLRPTPRCRLVPARDHHAGDRIDAQVVFDYDGTRVDPDTSDPSIIDAARRRVVFRDHTFEQQSLEDLLAAGAKAPSWPSQGPWIPATALVPLVTRLVASGWQVEALGRRVRQSGSFDISIESGIDWFDLNARADFDGLAAPLPALLRALARARRSSASTTAPSDSSRRTGWRAGGASSRSARSRGMRSASVTARRCSSTRSWPSTVTPIPIAPTGGWWRA